MNPLRSTPLKRGSNRGGVHASALDHVHGFPEQPRQKKDEDQDQQKKDLVDNVVLKRKHVILMENGVNMDNAWVKVSVILAMKRLSAVGTIIPKAHKYVRVIVNVAGEKRRCACNVMTEIWKAVTQGQQWLEV